MTKLLTPIAAILATVAMVIDTASAVETSNPSGLPLPPPATTPALADNADPVGKPPSEGCHILGARSFKIPFTVDRGGARPEEVWLFVMRRFDESPTWSRTDRRRTDQLDRFFDYTAALDGEYWFATRTVDSDGKQYPDASLQPQLKVYVDTTKPQVELHVDADADGRVEARLSIDDATPVKTMHLRYITDLEPTSNQVDVAGLDADGTIRFAPPGSWQRMSVQLVATDSAANQSVIQQDVLRPRLAGLPLNRFSASDPQTSGSQASETMTSKSPAQASDAQASDADSLAAKALDRPWANPRSGGSVTETQPAPYRMNLSRGTAAQTVSDYEVKLGQRPPTPPPSNQGYAPSGNVLHAFRGATPIPPASAPPPSIPRSMQSREPLATRSQSRPDLAPYRPVQTQRPTPNLPSGLPTEEFSFNEPNQLIAPTPAVSSAHAAPPQADMFPKPQSPMDEVGAPGPDRVSQSEPETNNESQPSRPRTAMEAMRPLSEESAVPMEEAKPKRIKSYRPLSKSADLSRSPVRHSKSERFSLEYELEAIGSLGADAIELYGSVDGGVSWDLWGNDPDRKSPFDIETKEEGVFAFRIVVVGNNGLASPRPQRGESPDITVVVDTTEPKVRITGAQYGEGNRIGALVIRYRCEDANLVQRPIALSFSDSVEGPWTTIAAGLRNDGDYVWPADPQLPRQLYLRIDATDAAGNTGTHILDQPIDTRGLAPRARIRGFQPLSGLSVPEIGEQTALRPSARIK